MLGKLLYGPTKLTSTEALVSPIPKMLQRRHESFAYLNGSSTILDVNDFTFDRILHLSLLLAGNDWRYTSESTLRRVNSEVLSVFVEDLITILTAFQI